MASFLFLKYISLALNAARSLILAAALGPASYGVLGTLVVAQQYMSYAALGMREGLTVRLAQPLGDVSAAQVHSSALAWGLGVGLAVLGTICAIDTFVHPLGAAWRWVGVVALLSISNEILININRDQGRLPRVALLEIAYNLAPLACVLWFRHDLTVVMVLQSIAAGLLLSVGGYLAGLRGAGWRHVRRGLVARLLVLGVPLAIASFFSTAVTSIYVFLANAMHLGDQVGHIVFANSICAIVLFGSNMVAWAATSKSMKGLAAGSGDSAEGVRNQRLAAFFRLAVYASSLALVSSKFVLALAMPAYAGSERYALLFCLLQSHGLLLYVELNFLAVHARSTVVVLGYGAMLGATLLVYLAFPAIALSDLVTVGIAVSMSLGMACTAYCRRQGLPIPTPRTHLASLAFPLLCALALRTAGLVAAGAVAAGFLVWTGWSFRQARRERAGVKRRGQDTPRRF